MKLHALICTYNCEDTIKQCLKALDRFVDVIHIFDGKWIGMEYEGTNSKDKTLLFITEFMEEANAEMDVIIAPESIHQCFARQVLVDQVPNGDWLLVIDSDEIVVKFPLKLKRMLEKSQMRGYRIFLKSKGKERSIPIPRLLKKTDGLHYTDNHRNVANLNGQIIYSLCPELSTFVFVHKQEKQIREVMEKYEKWLSERENQKNFTN